MWQTWYRCDDIIERIEMVLILECFNLNNSILEVQETNILHTKKPGLDMRAILPLKNYIKQNKQNRIKKSMNFGLNYVLLIKSF